MADRYWRPVLTVLAVVWVCVPVRVQANAFTNLISKLGQPSPELAEELIPNAEAFAIDGNPFVIRRAVVADLPSIRALHQLYDEGNWHQDLSDHVTRAWVVELDPGGAGEIVGELFGIHMDGRLRLGSRPTPVLQGPSEEKESYVVSIGVKGKPTKPGGGGSEQRPRATGDGSYQGLGLGRRLLDKYGEEAAAAGSQWMGLNVSEKNRKARRFYKGMGFCAAPFDDGRHTPHPRKPNTTLIYMTRQVGK